MLGAWTVQDTTLLCIPHTTMLDLMARTPEMSDIIITVFAGRRRRMLDSGEGSLTLIGAVAGFAEPNKVPVRMLILGEAEAEALAHACSITVHKPAVIFGKSEVIEPVTPQAVARKLGLDLEIADNDVVDVLIVGDVRAGSVKCVASAVGEGSVVMSRVWENVNRT